MSKFYYSDNEDGLAYPLSHYKELLKDENLPEIKLFEAEMETGTGYFFCTHFQEIGEVGEGCGKQCKAYKPRNGKNGRCVNSANCYEQTDKVKILKNN